MGINNAPNLSYYYSGETGPVMMNQGDHPINEGDLLYADANGCYAFDNFVHGASEAADQQALHTAFLGVSTQGAAGDMVISGGTVTSPGTPIRVNTTGRYRFKAGGTINQFQLVGPNLNTGSFIDAQIVKAVSTAKSAIGRAITAATAGQTVVVEILSTIVHGGPQNSATT